MKTLYLKNLAGDLTQILHNTEDETQWDLRQKLQKHQQILKWSFLVSNQVCLLASKIKACFTIFGILL